MLRIKHKIEQARRDNLPYYENNILKVVINGHKVKIIGWRATEIRVNVDDEAEYEIINPTVDNKYTLHQVLNGLRNEKCINPCSLCENYCVHCKCLKPCGLCEIRNVWRNNEPVTEKHRYFFISAEENYERLTTKLGL